MLYGVSLAYKESVNCRMEANVRSTAALSGCTVAAQVLTQGHILTDRVPAAVCTSARDRHDPAHDAKRLQT